MKATLKTADLLGVLNRVKPCLGKREPYAAYHLATADGVVLVIGNGGDSALMGKIKATITSKGETTLPPGAVEFLKAQASATVTVSTVHKTEEKKVMGQGHWENGHYVQGEEALQTVHTWKVNLEAGNSRISYPAADPKDIPELPMPLKTLPKLEQPLVLKDFGAALSEVSYAVAAKNDSRPILTCVAMAPDAKGVALIASDGFRLAKTSIKGSVPSTFAVDGDLLAILQKFGKTKFSCKKVQIAKERVQWVLVFESDGLTVMTCNAGDFPKWEKFIPEHTRRALRVDNLEFKDAIRTAISAVGSQGTIRLIGKGKTLRVIGLSDQTQAEVKIPSKGRIQQAYQANHLLAVLSRVGERVDILHDTEAKDGKPTPAIVRSNGSTHLMCAREVAEWTKADVKAEVQAPEVEDLEEVPA
jgi:DNA polymerase III sliding clamp (beta) subunit (PCNA family)